MKNALQELPKEMTDQEKIDKSNSSPEFELGLHEGRREKMVFATKLCILFDVWDGAYGELDNEAKEALVSAIRDSVTIVLC